VFWLIPAICALGAVVASMVGFLAAIAANRRLKPAIARIQASPLVAAFDAASTERALARIARDVNALRPLLDRAARALHDIGDGLRAMRLREAVAAVRIASVAVRALFALR
jgi:hypothetical protein